MTQHAKVLAKLATVVADRASERPLTWRLCEACRLLLGADCAAITIDNLTLDRLTLAATDDMAARLEAAQEVLGQGPGTDAFSTGNAVISDFDGGSNLRWPLFAEAARDVARSFGLDGLKIYAMPMRPGSSVLGVLTLVKHGRGALSEELDTAQFLSDAVGAALLRDPLSHADFGEGGPWSDRAEVHQAIGMVCAQLRVGPEDALALLKAHAFAHGTDLAAVSQLVISRRLDFAVSS